MASRRKSAKPTNKLRHVHIESDDDDETNDEDECGDSLMQGTCVSLSTTPINESTFHQTTKDTKSNIPMPTIQVNCPLSLGIHPLTYDTSLLAQHVKDQTAMPVSEVVEPLLALPSDVYKDFEALRSVTKLDSPALMRRLLKYYSKLTTSTVERERKLDNVIEGIRGRSSSTVKLDTSYINNTSSSSTTINNNNNNNVNNAPVVLDLTIHKKSHDEQSLSSSSKNTTNDDSIDSNDPESSPRPLDLTLQKEEYVAAVPEVREPPELPNVQHGTASSLFSTCFQTPAVSSCVYSSTDSNQAAPYVINLEPLTSTIQLSTPIQKTNNAEQGAGIQLPMAYNSTLQATIGEGLLCEGSFLYSKAQKSLVSNILTNSQNTKPSLVPITTQHSQADSKQNSYPPSALFPLPNVPLPSYREAVDSSTQLQHKTSSISSHACDENGKLNTIVDDSKPKIDLHFKRACNDLANYLINSDGRHISVLQLKPDFNDINSVQSVSATLPENFLLEPVFQKNSPSKESLSNSNFLLAESMPTLSAKLASLSSSSIKPPAYQENPRIEEKTGLPLICKSEQHGQRIQMSHMTSNTARSPPSSSSISGNTIIHNLLSKTTQSSQNALSQSSLPLQSLLMSQTSDGAVNNVVAIPVLQGLPEGYSTLQHFTFESPVPLPAKSEIPNTPLTTTALPLQPIIVSAPISTSNDPFPPETCPVTSHPLSFATTMPSEPNQAQNYSAQAESNREWVKLKPGRPKGRAGKINSSRKNQNKGMKLVTEHSLFPGVYTSILKLPWSKRTRNKSKTKPEAGVKADQHEGFGDNTVGNLEVESEEKSMSDSTYIPPELIDNMKDTMGEIVQDELKEPREESLLQIQRQQINLDQQQHTQHFSNQYQIHVSEEQQKTKDEMDRCRSQSPCATPLLTPQGNSVFSENTQQSTMNIKREMCDVSEICSEIRHNVMLSSASIAVGQEQSNISNSQDPIMLIYPNIGPNGSKSKKRRGRPPKKPMVEQKVHQDSFLFPVESILQSSESISDTSFLHGNNSNLPLIPHTSIHLNQDLTLMSPTTHSNSLPSLEKVSNNTLKPTIISSDLPSNVKENDKTTLENRIIFLTNQIEIEMARVANQQPKEQSSVNTIDTKQLEQCISTEQKPEESPTPMDKSEDKPVQVIKRRRKKTSRMLKSNENFVYATFRFKPRGGSGTKKTKKKRKTNVMSLAANAETIANLRNKKLKCSERADSEIARNELGVQSWKFHEQYPSEAYRAKSPVPTLSITSCSLCGVPVRKIDDLPKNLQFCKSCSRTQADQSKDDTEDGSPHYGNDTMYDNHSMGEKERETVHTSCISCGKGFEGFSDTDSQCESCRRNTQSFIGSSKLFSIPDSTYPKPGSSSNVPTPSTSHPGHSLSEHAVGISSFDPNSPLTTDGILYCSLCRMQFNKINEYLLHLKETHESAESCKITPSFLKEDIAEIAKSQPDSIPRRMKSALKTKKSLAHKTITCPVEDCPLFFRHQRDMDHHLKKVHQSISTLASREAFTTTKQKDILAVQKQISNLKQVAKSVHMSVEDSHTNIFNQPPSISNSVTVTLEENGESHVTVGQTNEKPLRCSFCNFRCRQKNAMTWHMRKHPEAASQHRRYSNASSE